MLFDYSGMDAEQRERTFLIATTEVEEKSPGGFSFCTSKKKKKKSGVMGFSDFIYLFWLD